jgi:hypothetical protein
MKSRTGLACGLVLVVEGSAPLRADFTTYNGIDPGAGPTDPRPQATAAAASFDAAAGLLGAAHSITFEGLANSLPATDNDLLTVASGVTLTTSGTDHNPLPGFSYGTSGGTPIPAHNGYNTTPGGTEFFDLVPLSPASGVRTASVDFRFATPIRAFGLYLTGLGNITGNTLVALFDDGTPRQVAITGSSTGGVQFWGLTDPGASIRDVKFQLTGATADSRDLFGLDNVRFVSVVPEPSAAVLTVLGALGLLTLARARRILGRGSRGV